MSAIAPLTVNAYINMCAWARHKRPRMTPGKDAEVLDLL